MDYLLKKTCCPGRWLKSMVNLWRMSNPWNLRPQLGGQGIEQKYVGNARKTVGKP